MNKSQSLDAIFGGISLYPRTVSVNASCDGLTTVDISLVTSRKDVMAEEIVDAFDQPAWTSCAMALPTSDDHVLVSRDGDVSVSTYWGDEWDISPPPTHWMPMPKAPRMGRRKKKR